MRKFFQSLHTYSRLYLFVCIVGAYALTLYPYNFFQRNNVTLRADGLVFAQPSTAYTLRAHEALSYLYQFTFLLRVTPEADEAAGYSTRIMSSGRDTWTQNFAIGQSHSALVVQFFSRDSKQFNELTIPDVFKKRKSSWIALTFNGATVRCYVNGVMKAARRTGPMALTQWDSTYPVVFATDPSGMQQWEGVVHTAAIFDRAFRAADLRRPDLIFKKYSSIIHYEFGRRSLGYIPSSGDDPDSVYVPELYTPYHRSTLFDSFRLLGRQRLYVRDIVANIVLFLPIGIFSALAFRRRAHGIASCAALSVCLGLMLSVSIEVLQIFLPSRYSSMLDVLSNTAGAAVGVLCAFVIRPPANNSRQTAAPI